MGKRVVLWVGFFVLLGAVSCWAVNAIQTQPATSGPFEADLIKASVRNNVLTIQVAFRCQGPPEDPIEFYFKDVYLTDLKNKKKYYPLKDSSGRYLAGPADSWLEGGAFKSYMRPGGRVIFWIKFPAPPADVQTIDIMVPGFLPFEDVPITRR